MTNDVVIVHYSEVALKLGQRTRFVERLMDNVRRSLASLGTGAVRTRFGHIVVELDGASEAAVVERLRRVPGVANCLPALRVEPSLEVLEAAVTELLATWSPAGTFAVRVRRADKQFPHESPEVGRRLGALVVARTGAAVNLRRPDDELHVMISREAIYVATDRVLACGGLPVSTGGRLTLLLSGGIDSPVAGLRMMRRGCRLDAVHFHSVPYLNGASIDKARQLAAVLARGQQRLKLHMVAFGDAQSEVVRFVPRPLRVVLYRRLMLRIACKLARRSGGRGLVTGESLGQVASQTLINMTTIERASTLPILRPLVGMDKLEITRYAEAEDTYEISILPDQDCCTLFVPRHPATAASERDVLAAETLVEVERLVDEAVAATETEVVEAVWSGGGA